jgi:hypothetical protein
MDSNKSPRTNLNAPIEGALPPMDIPIDSPHVDDGMNSFPSPYGIAPRSEFLSPSADNSQDPWDPNPDGDESYVWASSDLDYQFENTTWLDLQGE